MIYRILSYLFLVLFIAAIIFITIPFSFLVKEKQIVHVLLLDSSLSVNIKATEYEKIYARIESSIASNDAVVRGYFADKALFLDEDIKSVDSSNKKELVLEWLKNSETFKSYLDLNSTNLEFVAREAFEKWSDKGLVHILMLTDGKENTGKIINIREFMIAQDSVLTIVPMLETPDDIFIKNLTVPENILVNQTFTIETSILATKSFSKVPLQINVGKDLIIKQEIDLKKGKNTFLFSANINSPGLFEITTKVIYKDIFQENNSLTIQANTSDIKQILVVSENSDPSVAHLSKNCKIISPIDFPHQVLDLLAFACLILDDIHWNKILDTGKIDALREYINRGGKLFVVGGTHSFGFGDYLGTDLEKLLPVKINPNGLVSMAVGIDISGSMESEINGMRKIDIAINSLLDIVKSLEPNDELGVHLYNEKRSKKDLWIPLTAVKEFENEFNEKIKILPKPTGGTFILPALQTLYETLSTNERLLRIAVIISDGETQETNFEEVLKKFQEIKPPISFILIGADLSPESQLVLAGKKVFGPKWEPVYLDKRWNLKECFNDALKKIASGFSDDGQFKIFVNQAHPLSRMIQPFDGSFKGIILKTRLKPGSSTLLDIDDRFPLLAHRHLGQGEVISFQSGFFDNWAGPWLKSNQGLSFQSMISSWMQQSQNSSIKVSVDNSTNGFAVKIDSALKSMSSFAEVQIKLSDLKLNCIKNSNTTWSCVLNDRDVPKIKQNEIFQIYCHGEDGKEILIGDGIFPPIISKEILDIYETNFISSYFTPVNNNWRWAEDKVPNVEIKSYTSVSHPRFFFLLALGSLLLAIFCRGRTK